VYRDEDVRFTYEVARDSLVGWPTRAWKRDIVACRCSTRTRALPLRRAAARAFRFAKEGFVIPGNRLADVARERWGEAAFGRAPLGTGLSGSRAGRSSSASWLVRNENYYEKDKPWLDRIVFQIVPMRARRAAAARRGSGLRGRAAHARRPACGVPRGGARRPLPGA